MGFGLVRLAGLYGLYATVLLRRPTFPKPSIAFLGACGSLALAVPNFILLC